jgi:hypothetical protein
LFSEFKKLSQQELAEILNRILLNYEKYYSQELLGFEIGS